MRILHVISSLDPRAGGPTMVISRLAATQASLGHDVCVLCYGLRLDKSGANPNPEIDQKLDLIPGWKKVKLIRLAPPGRAEWAMSGTAGSELRKAIPNVDIVHIHGIWDPILRAAATAARELNKPYVLAPHGMLDPWALTEKSLKKKFALKLGYGAMVHGASLMHAASPFESECIANFQYRGPIEIIPNGVSLEEIDPLPAKGSFIEAYPKLAGRRFICFLSRLHAVKGLDLLAEAFHSLAAKHPDVDLVVVGPDFGAKAPFESQVAQYKLTHRVHLIGSLWGRDRFKPIVDSACFCLPSEHESFGIAICEAMACATPVVITENCGLREACEEGAGLVVKRNATDLAAALDFMLSNPTEASAMGAKARRLVEERFTWPKVADLAIAAYKSICRDGRKSLAIIANVQAPYRLATHQRICRELPDLHLWSMYTHGVADQAWSYHVEKEINPVSFGPGEDCINAQHPRSWPREFAKGGEMMRFIKREGIQAVIVSGYNDPGRLRVIVSCWLSGIPVFLAGDSNIRGDRARGLRKFVKNIVLRSALYMCRGALPFGSNGKDYFASYGADPQNIWFFPAEPDYEIFSKSDPILVEQVRSEFNLEPSRRRIVYCGRLARAKRVDLLIDAFSQIAQERPDWDLVIIGDGPLNKELREHVPSAIQHRVRWTGFIENPRKVSAIYHLCDTFVLPSEFEPWAVVVNETAIAGLALCVSDVVGAARELVVEGENGCSFETSNPAAISAAILKCTDNATINDMKNASLKVAAQWRTLGNPVQGVRAALASAGISFA